jgi:hypothetical protein
VLVLFSNKYLVLMVNNAESRQFKCHGGLDTAATNGFRTLQPFPTATKRTSFVIRILDQRSMVRAGSDLRSPARPSSLMAVFTTSSSRSDVNDERHKNPASEIDLQSYKLSLVSDVDDLASPASPSSLMTVELTFSSCSNDNDERHAKPAPDIESQ